MGEAKQTIQNTRQKGIYSIEYHVIPMMFYDVVDDHGIIVIIAVVPSASQTLPLLSLLKSRLYIVQFL